LRGRGENKNACRKKWDAARVKHSTLCVHRKLKIINACIYIKGGCLCIHNSDDTTNFRKEQKRETIINCKF
jgi:hypothetical protein